MKTIKVYRSGIHLGEEKKVAGNHASGMVYLSGCHLACNFCYTPETSIHGLGKDFTPVGFHYLLEGLIRRGARNLNLVSPTHVWKALRRPVQLVKMRYGELLPLVLKTSGYETKTIGGDMAQIADVLVPDFKVWSRDAARAVNLPERYGRVALDAIEGWMRTHGQPRTNREGLLSHGLLVRHLVMPGYDADSINVIKALGWIGFRGHLNLLTYFVDSPNGRVINTQGARVGDLVSLAESYGMSVMVNGKPPLRAPVYSPEVSSYAT